MIKITDSESNISFLKYIEESLLQNVKSLGGEMNLIVENERSVLGNQRKPMRKIFNFNR